MHERFRKLFYVRCIRDFELQAMQVLHRLIHARVICESACYQPVYLPIYPAIQLGVGLRDPRPNDVLFLDSYSIIQVISRTVFYAENTETGATRCVVQPYVKYRDRTSSGPSYTRTATKYKQHSAKSLQAATIHRSGNYQIITTNRKTQISLMLNFINL